MIRSLQTRLLLGMIGGMILLLLVFNGIIYYVIRHGLYTQFDSSLIAAARMLAATVEYDKEKIELELDADLTEFQKADRPAYFQFWDQQGTVLLRSPSLGTDDLPWSREYTTESGYSKLQLSNGLWGRAVTLNFTPRVDPDEEASLSKLQDTQPFTLVVARDTADLTRQLNFLLWLLLNASLAIIILSIIVALVVVRRALQPVNALASSIASIKDENLDQPINVEKLPREILPIKERLNELLIRLEASFQRERRFTADMAHELRTPLAGIRSTLEVTLSRDRPVEEYQTALRDALHIAQTMQATLDNLLALARLDTQPVTIQSQPVHLADLVNSVWQNFTGPARSRRIDFSNQLTDDLIFESDPKCLTIIFSNLLANAVEYADQGGRIWISAAPTDEHIEITLANTGSSLTPEQIPHVFDRFWRADPARAGVGLHCGLGLALVQRITTTLHGTISASIRNENIFTIQFSLPLKS